VSRDPVLNRPVANILWIIRTLRQEVGAPITEAQVYEKQRSVYGYNRLEIARIIGEIEDRGFRWKHHYEGVPDTCILVGEAQVLAASLFAMQRHSEAGHETE